MGGRQGFSEAALGALPEVLEKILLLHPAVDPLFPCCEDGRLRDHSVPFNSKERSGAIKMSGAGRKTAYRKAVTEEVLSGYPEPDAAVGELVARVEAPRGGNIIEVACGNGHAGLALLPQKFRKLVWVKRGDWVIVSGGAGKDIEVSDGKDGAVRYIVQHVLYKEQVRHLKKQKLWPSMFDDDGASADAAVAAAAAEFPPAATAADGSASPMPPKPPASDDAHPDGSGSGGGGGEDSLEGLLGSLMQQLKTDEGRSEFAAIVSAEGANVAGVPLVQPPNDDAATAAAAAVDDDGDDAVVAAAAAASSSPTDASAPAEAAQGAEGRRGGRQRRAKKEKKGRRKKRASPSRTWT